MHLYLITHAHTSQDATSDARTWQLSAFGTQQADALARLPMWDSIQCIGLSTEQKSLLTVKPVLAEADRLVVADSRFDELRRVGWVENYAEQVQAAFERPDDSIDGWEPAATALARFVEGVQALCLAHQGETLALVSHGLVLSLYRAHLLGQARVEFADWQNLDFGAVAIVNPVAGKLLSDFEATVEGPGRAS